MNDLTVQAAKAALTRARLDHVLEAAGVRRRLTLMRDFPEIVCLCGSTRFSWHFQQANLQETLKGKIVLSIGCDLRSDEQLFVEMSAEELEATKAQLDALHLMKIELADEVYILNVNGYIGTSTQRELDHALKLGKRVRYYWQQGDAYEDRYDT